MRAAMALAALVYGGGALAIGFVNLEAATAALDAVSAALGGS
jgi:hypothetical protein